MKRVACSSRLGLTVASTIAAAVFLFPTVAGSQSAGWTTFTSGADVPSLADAGDHLWVGGGGVTRLNKATGEMVRYTANSGLPDNRVRPLVVDPQGNLWVGTEVGLARFDGENWEVFNTGNSGLPDNGVSSLVFDSQGDLWVGTWRGRLARFDGESWEVYNEDNSGLPDAPIWSLVVDAQGDLWIGTSSSSPKLCHRCWPFKFFMRPESGHSLRGISARFRGGLPGPCPRSSSFWIPLPAVFWMPGDPVLTGVLGPTASRSRCRPW